MVDGGSSTTPAQASKDDKRSWRKALNPQERLKRVLKTSAGAGDKTNKNQAQKEFSQESTAAAVSSDDNHLKQPTLESQNIVASSTSRRSRWLASFARSDPRWQIREFFAEVSNVDVVGETSKTSSNDQEKPAAFTVWRPTNAIAIQRMIAGEATGKGLEIKGKSAKKGKLSGYVPYLQIHEERHKKKCKTLSRSGRTRIFFATESARNDVLERLEPLQNQILNAVHDAKRTVRNTVLASFTPVRDVSHGVASRTESLRTGLISSRAGSAVLQTVSSSTSAVKAGRAGSAVRQTVTSSTSAVKSGVLESMNRAGTAVLQLRDETAPKAITSKVKFTASKFRDLGSMAVRSERALAIKHLLLDMDDASIRSIDDYAPQCYGIELPDRLLWQAFVVDSDISRPIENTDLYSGRPSEPAFQDMNSIAIFKTRKNGTKHRGGKIDEPRVVLWQTCGTILSELDLMDPRGLIMAYEEDGRILPVVSDFDCFTMGTRGVAYTTPLPNEQVELLEWCVSKIDSVLDQHNNDDSSSSDVGWTSRWLEVLKASAADGFHPTVPRFGFGDATSYSIMENAVSHLKTNGAVRHGAECFNYYFPQDLDDEFLIVSDTLPGKGSWKYVNAAELREFLLQKIDEGFTFPLNPKWVLCDEGWNEIYDRLISTDSKNVQESLNIWFPPNTKVRESIEAIRTRHPEGYVVSGERDEEMDGTAAMDLATLRLDNFMAVRRARAKIRSALIFRRLLQEVREARSSAQTSDFKSEHLTI